MRQTLAVIGGLAAALVFVVVLGALGLGGRWLNLHVERWFAPREANVQREVFEETKSFNEAKEQELGKVYREYLTASETEKAGLRSYVAHTFADYPIERLDVELQKFVRTCKGF